MSDDKPTAAKRKSVDWRAHWPPLIRKQLGPAFKGTVLYNYRGEYVAKKTKDECLQIAREFEAWSNDDITTLWTMTID